MPSESSAGLQNPGVQGLGEQDALESRVWECMVPARRRARRRRPHTLSGLSAPVQTPLDFEPTTLSFNP